jgi:hypothetical protein
MDGAGSGELERHVNAHLDDDEQQESAALASTLTYLDSNSEPYDVGGSGQATGQASRSLDGTPGIETGASADDRSRDGGRLSGATFHEPSYPSSGWTDATLRGGLADSAENVLEDIGSRLAKCYNVTNTRELQRVHICSNFDMYTTSIAGVGFDCGFRNAAMLMSCLLHDKEICSVLAKSGVRDVPVIMEMQSRIEEAWNKDGFDPAGAAHFEHRLVGREVWIGACEIVVLFRSLGLRAGVADFEFSAGTSSVAMLRWVYDYFDQRCRRPASGPSSQGCLRCRNPLFGRRGSLIPPLVLQHQGHSRTIAGVEMTKKGEIRLLVVDPLRSFAAQLAKVGKNGHSVLPLVRVGSADLDMLQYQVVFVPEHPCIESDAEFTRLKTIVNAIGPCGAAENQSVRTLIKPPQ